MNTDPAVTPARPDRRAGKTPAQLWVDGIAHLEAFIAEHGTLVSPMDTCVTTGCGSARG